MRQYNVCNQQSRLLDSLVNPSNNKLNTLGTFYSEQLKKVSFDRRSETHTDTYEANNTPGNNTLNGVTPDAVKASINTEPKGVRVIDVNIAHMKLMIIIGATNDEDAAEKNG